VRSNDPRTARLGAAAGLAPALMFAGWVLVQGWSGSPTQFVVSFLALSLVAALAGWVVGSRLGVSVLSSLVGLVAYVLTASFIYVPIGAIGSTAQGGLDGSYADLGALLGGLIGFAAYGFVTSVYAWIFLIPLGVGWIVAFRLLQRTAPRAGPAKQEPDGKPSMTSLPYRAMHPIAQWIAWFGLGAGDALLFGIGGLVLAGPLVALAVAIAFRGDAAAAVSGLLVGFGTTWLLLMARQAATGGRLDDPAPWLAVGIVPVAVGAGLAVWRLARNGP
jgi:hypothetical protein